MSGFRLASREACKYIKEVLATNVDTLGRDCIVHAAKTSISSKNIGMQADYFANLAVDALNRVKHIDQRGQPKFSVPSVNVLKCHGKSASESLFIEGYALNCTRASQGLLVACFKECFLAQLLMNL